ncbi:UDP-glucose 4-epimerase [Planctomycetes bacterium Poly30]|uniref:UDP-glucose 4-epimerase n=1 Tax=Saltatorellus ferox TaxID=2528018 RepID=A0A518ERS2_9BACT|nr:UDP-glucose 4-epimerase [Planctomycetes bacterium Poly30]
MRDTSHVLITGAAGLIGSSVARVLRDRGVRVTGLDDLSAGHLKRLDPLMEAPEGDGFRFLEGDVRDRDRLLQVMLGGPLGPVTSVLHLAGRVGVRRFLQDPVACEEENLDLGRSVAAAVRHARGQGRTLRVIAASTSEVYAESDQPLSEKSPLRPLVAEGRWRYAASKLAAELVLDRVVHDAVHLRFFNVVGPGQDGGSGMVLPRFIEAARSGQPLRIHGQGTQVRTFAHVDAVSLDVAALAAPEAFPHSSALADFRGALNVGGFARTTILGLAEEVARAVAHAGGVARAPLQFVDPSVDVGENFEDVHHRVPDLGELRSLGLGSRRLGSAAWSLEEIIRDVVHRHPSARGDSVPKDHPGTERKPDVKGAQAVPCELPVS